MAAVVAYSDRDELKLLFRSCRAASAAEVAPRLKGSAGRERNSGVLEVKKQLAVFNAIETHMRARQQRIQHSIASFYTVEEE
jgi:hypothetical protein